MLYLVHIAQLDQFTFTTNALNLFLFQDGPPTGSGAPEGQLQQQMPSKWNAHSVDTMHATGIGF